MEQIATEVDSLRMRTVQEYDKASRFRAPYQGWVSRIRITVPDSKKITIPKLYIKEDESYAVAYAGGTNLNTPYRIITGANQGVYSQYDDYSGMPSIIIEGQELTFRNTSANEVEFIGVFEDPSDLEDDYGYITGFDNFDGAIPSNYPAPDGIIDIIIGKTADSYLRTMYRIAPQPNKQIDEPRAEPERR